MGDMCYKNVQKMPKSKIVSHTDTTMCGSLSF
jgi:hypothetical protein